MKNTNKWKKMYLYSIAEIKRWRSFSRAIPNPNAVTAFDHAITILNRNKPKSPPKKKTGKGNR